MKHDEFRLQQNVCKYLQIKYPNVLFFSDTIANVKLNVYQGARNKSIQKNGFKMPDLVILQPNYYHAGLLIELKIKSPYKKNGELLANEHLQGQQRSMDELNKLGYKALFSVGYDQTIEIIDEYMSHVLK
jgi:hypothetical protein